MSTPAVCEIDSVLTREGAQNLLRNCVGLQSGQQLLIVREPDSECYYDQLAPDTVEREAVSMGAQVHSLRTPTVMGPDDAPEFLRITLEHVDHTVFFSRIGDQMRFYPLPGPGTKTMCYALDAQMLAGEACRVPYQLTLETLSYVQSRLDHTTHWRVTCPSGTDISGSSEPVVGAPDPKTAFTIRLFPLGPFRTFSCAEASGRLVSRWLPGSATHRYEPYGLILEEPVALMIEHGRIIDFEGPSRIAQMARDHYEHVGSCFDIDPFVVHSWHGGTNPKIFYPGSAESDIERWNGVLHSHPRYIHFHTCGAYNPGEIAVGLVDASVFINDEPYWEQGRLTLLDRDDAHELLDRYPGQENAFEMCMDIGI